MTQPTLGKPNLNSLALPDGFEALDKLYAKHPPDAADLKRFGQYAITNASILETPRSVQDRGEILTNPSQIEVAHITIKGAETAVQFAYFRQEPTTMHLGRTAAVPYLILPNAQGKPYLTEFVEATPLLGEDPRIMPGVNIKGALGKIHKGWTVSTVEATAKPDNPAEVEGIKQVIYWGENLGKLEPVAEIPDLKNACIFPAAQTSGIDTDIRVHLFGRPHPDITYSCVASLSHITKDAIESGQNITKSFLPAGIRVGVNTVNSVPGHPDYLELDIHEAYETNEAGKILHYRLGRYGFELSTGKVKLLGVIARRSDFPMAAPKPPENDVSDYMDILYGSMGYVGRMVTGVSDRHVGIADVVPIWRS